MNGSNWSRIPTLGNTGDLKYLNIYNYIVSHEEGAINRRDPSYKKHSKWELRDLEEGVEIFG